ncbi:MAG TPA: TRAP transporter substrate-binding protein DctP [Anaeromyxobacteraceae bacterium]
MKKTLAALLLAAAPPPAPAQEVTLKLGTLAPVGSSWHALLKELTERWGEVSGGKVRLRVYAGGTQGSEGDMVRKMAVGQLHAASITTIGMHDILTEPAVFSTPGMVDGEAEFRAVFPRVEKKLEALVEQKGWVVLHWAQVGTVYVFCTKGYRTPAEAADGKFFAWDGDPAAIAAFQRVGFRPVVLSSTDLVPSLQTGMITCVTQAPAFVLTARLFERANHMMDYPWAFLIGATVVRREAWERVPGEIRPRLLAVARELGARIDAEAKRLNDDAVAAMRKQGLVLVPVDGQAWRAAAERSWPAIRGKVVPAAFFDEVARNHAEWRKANR